MFRHLVITGRSRLALYLARIPAGLAIVIAMVAIGYAIVCAVCVFAAPTQFSYDGVIVPQGLSRPALDNWAAAHADEVICNFNYNGPSVPPNVPCGNGNGPTGPNSVVRTPQGTVVPVDPDAGADPGIRRHDGQPGLRRLPRHLPGPLDLADDRRRPVDRAARRPSGSPSASGCPR